MVGQSGGCRADGFWLDTMATGLHNVGFWSAGPTLALAICFGGTAQFIAGIVDLRKGSIFGGSAFMCYGAFWWSLFVLLYIQPKTGIAAGKPEELGFFLMWTLFTFGFCLAAHKIGKYLAALFWLLFLAFRIAGRCGYRDGFPETCRLGDLYRWVYRLVYRHGDFGECMSRQDGSAAFVESGTYARKRTLGSVTWRHAKSRFPT